MRYRSTRGEAPSLTFDEVLVQGLAPDSGLYLPQRFPPITPPDTAYADLAVEVIGPYVEGSVIEGDLDSMARQVYGTFRDPDVAPLRDLGENHYLLELFWGPTLSFKDYALQMVGAMFEKVLQANGRSMTVLGATSGDTGSAAIEALAGRDGVEVVILYPLGRVSEIQRRQMTTVESSNVRALAVEGTFDDCQALVKAAFMNRHLRSVHSLSAVNSINWARIMVQAVYHWFAALKVGGGVTMGVPTGNFGNVLAAEVARRMGAPIERMVIGNNSNHGLDQLIRTGRLELSPVIPTVAPAMDIQVPSNLERYLYLLLGEDGIRLTKAMEDFRSDGEIVLEPAIHSSMKAYLGSQWLTDEEILAVIARAHDRHGLVLDPHTATAFEVSSSGPVVSIATAHPAKFADTVASALGFEPDMPADLAGLADKPERIEVIPAELGSLAEVLSNR